MARSQVPLPAHLDLAGSRGLVKVRFCGLRPAISENVQNVLEADRLGECYITNQQAGSILTTAKRQTHT